MAESLATYLGQRTAAAYLGSGDGLLQCPHLFGNIEVREAVRVSDGVDSWQNDMAIAAVGFPCLR